MICVGRVRTLLLPALMRVLGRANWWAPAPLSRLHRRVALSEAGEHVNGALATPVGDTRGREPALR